MLQNTIFWCSSDFAISPTSTKLKSRLKMSKKYPPGIDHKVGEGISWCIRWNQKLVASHHDILKHRAVMLKRKQLTWNPTFPLFFFGQEKHLSISKQLYHLGTMFVFFLRELQQNKPICTSNVFFAPLCTQKISAPKHPRIANQHPPAFSYKKPPVTPVFSPLLKTPSSSIFKRPVPITSNDK